MKSSGLTLYILFDATTSADGNTYDRPSIEGWFQLGNITSPLTGLELATEMIFPNISQLNTPNYPEMNNLPKSLPPRHLTKLPPRIATQPADRLASLRLASVVLALRKVIMAWREQEGAALIKKSKGAPLDEV